VGLATKQARFCDNEWHKVSIFNSFNAFLVFSDLLSLGRVKGLENVFCAMFFVEAGEDVDIQEGVAARGVEALKGEDITPSSIIPLGRFQFEGITGINRVQDRLFGGRSKLRKAPMDGVSHIVVAKDRDPTLGANSGVEEIIVGSTFTLSGHPLGQLAIAELKQCRWRESTVPRT